MAKGLFRKVMDGFLRKQKREFSLERWVNFLDLPWTNKSHMTYDRALAISTFKSCVRVIAESLATTPLTLYRKTDDGRKEEATDQPEYDIFKNVSNADFNQPAVLFWETLLISCATTGNGYAWIQRQTKGPGAGRVKALWNLHPDDVKVKRDGNYLFYEVSDSCNPNFNGGKPLILFPGEVLHLANFSENGITGMNPLRYHKSLLATAQHQSDWQENFFAQGIMPRGMLTTDSEIPEEEEEDIKAAWNAVKDNKVVVMPFGLTYKSITMKAEDVEIAEQYNLTERQICGIMRVPLPFVQNHENSTYSNAEQNDLVLLKHCIRAWAFRLEKTIDTQVLTASQRAAGMYTKFNLDALYRGNLLERYQAHNIAIVAGFKTRNEVRAEEDKDPLDGLDEPLVPLNMTTDLESISGDGESKSVQKSRLGWSILPLNWFRKHVEIEDITAEKQRLMRLIEDKSEPIEVERVAITEEKGTIKRLIDHEFRKVFEKEKVEVIKAASKMTAQEFDAWLARFSSSQEQYFRKNLTPVLVDVCEKLDPIEAAQEAKTYALNMQSRLRSVLSMSKDWADFPVQLVDHYENQEWRRDASVLLLKKMTDSERRAS